MRLTRIKLNSLAVALLLSIDALCYALPGIGIGTFYSIVYVAELICVLLPLVGLAFTRKTVSLRRKKTAAYYSFLVLCYFASSILVPNYNYSLIIFLFVFAFAVVIIQIEFSIEEVLTYMLYMSWLVIPCYSSIFAYQWEGLNQASMGSTYAVFVWITASLLHFIYYRKEHNKLFLICYIPGAIALYGFLQFANRGAVLALFTLIVLIILNKSVELKSGKNLIKKRIFVITMLVISYAIVINYDLIFMAVYDLLDSVLTEMPSFFVKTQRMIEIKDIGNGRDEVYATAINGFMNSPILGHGIESFSVYTIYPYPHNFVLQLLYEGGFLFCIIPVAVIIYATYKLIFSQIRNKQHLVSLILLYVQVKPRFILRASIWREKFFWIFVFYVLAHYIEMKNDEKNLERKVVN